MKVLFLLIVILASWEFVPNNGELILSQPAVELGTPRFRKIVAIGVEQPTFPQRNQKSLAWNAWKVSELK